MKLKDSSDFFITKRDIRFTVDEMFGEKYNVIVVGKQIRKKIILERNINA